MKWTTKYVIAALAALAPAAWAADALDVWTASDSGTENTFRSVAYGNGQFVAVGYAGTILTSLDGASWTKRDSGTPHALAGVAFGGGKFMAVGGEENNRTAIMLTSLDGSKWTQVEITIPSLLYAVTYGENGCWVAVGGSGQQGAVIASSSDSVNWKVWSKTPLDPTIDASDLTGVAYGNGRFVAVFPGHDLSTPEAWTFTSTNGVDWAQNNGPKGVRAVTFGNGLFVGAGGFVAYTNRSYVGHAVVYSSKDGINWTLHTDVLGDSGNQFSGVTYGAGQFVAVGDRWLYSSSDGIQWVLRGDSYNVSSPDHVLGVVYGNGQFITVGLSGKTTRSGMIGKLGASLSPNGSFLGTITGVNGQNYSIQSSANLGEWLDLTSVTISNGIGQFTDPSATNLNRRFYKALGISQ